MLYEATVMQFKKKLIKLFGKTNVFQSFCLLICHHGNSLLYHN